MEAINLTQSLQSNRLHLGITALNGVMGERLRNSNNPLAVNMGFYHQNQPLALTPGQFQAVGHEISNKLVVFVHGLASNEQMWGFPREGGGEEEEPLSYGTMLMRDHGFTPLYLRYNSGLRVSHNGQLLAALLDELLEVYPGEVKELILIGHSLGGLLIRSACHYGQQSGHDWTSLLSKAIYLGTPHHGVPWESLLARLIPRMARSDNWLIQKLYALHESRSPSIRDIVDLTLIEEHWQSETAQPPLPWFEGIEHYFVAGSINRDPNHLLSHAFGDVLVPIGSAHARSAQHSHMPTPPRVQQHSAIVPGVKHIALAHHTAVYQHLEHWVGAGS